VAEQAAKRGKVPQRTTSARDGQCATEVPHGAAPPPRRPYPKPRAKRPKRRLPKPAPQRMKSKAEHCLAKYISSEGRKVFAIICEI
jgi:hypothetical protein